MKKFIILSCDGWGHDGDDDGDGDVWVGAVIKIPAPHVTVLVL